MPVERRHPTIAVAEAMPLLTDTERQVGRFVLRDPGRIGDLSIQQVAAESFVSPATVVRMCKKIGFAGYRQFRGAIIAELSSRRAQISQVPQAIAEGDSLRQIADKTIALNQRSLEDTLQLLDAEVLEQCVQLLQRSERILFFGIGASYLTAKDAYMKFMRLNVACCLDEDWHTQLVSARNSSSADVAIAVSYSGMTFEVVECMKALRENGTPIIAVTRALPSAVSDLATVRLYTTSVEPLFRSGAIASRISQLCVIDILFNAFAQQDRSRALRYLSRTHVAKG